MNTETLLKVEQLRKYYPTGGGLFGRGRADVKAVDGIDLTVRKGETLSVVGESGCGKTTLGRCLLRLEAPTAGTITFDGQPLLDLPPARMRRMRRHLQMIFQDPYSSLNPRKNVGQIIGDAFTIHSLLTRAQRRQRIMDLLTTVGMRPEHAMRYPHEFSGGQRQRIGVARALALNPKLIVADEPVSALDVSVQAQILNLLVTLQNKLGLTYLFISHDLGVVRHISDRVAVMYLGRIVEMSPSRELFAQPRHPYTEALVSAVPLARRHKQTQRILLRGDVPSPLTPPPGCHFHPRCHYQRNRCIENTPQLRNITPGRKVACHFPLS